MRLILTIQDVKTKEGLTRGLFGTLNVSKPDKNGVYDKKHNQSFMCNLNEIKGLPKIVRNIQVSVLGLKYQGDRKKENEKKVSKKRVVKTKSRRKADKV